MWYGIQLDLLQVQAVCLEANSFSTRLEPFRLRNDSGVTTALGSDRERTPNPQAGRVSKPVASQVLHVPHGPPGLSEGMRLERAEAHGILRRGDPG